MDPFTIALATFGVQKLRGKSTKRALRDAAILGGGAYGFGKLAATGSVPGVTAGQGILGNIGQGSAFSSLGVGTGAQTAGQQNFLQKMLGQKGLTAEEVKAAGLTGKEATAAMKGKGIMGLGTGEKLFLAGSLIPLVEGEDKPVKPPFTEEDYKKAYAEQSAKLEGGFEPVANARPSLSDVYADEEIYQYNTGGIVQIKKFNKGGVNYLPSKTDHNENDYNNYVRAQGYVEDGSGNGDKDEDTMLAQLADGEFVSRADAVLGAGILAGADPTSYKTMRKKGAEFFYDQQKKFKRIYDLVNASKTVKH
jgi:hypothetical protein